jgi:hypothetical protein
MNEEKTKQFIEKTMRDYDLGNDIVQVSLSPIWNAAMRSIEGRVSYEFLKRLEEGENVFDNYKFPQKPSFDMGIPISFKKVPKSIWIPNRYKERMSNAKDDFYKTINLFNRDTLNEFNWNPDMPKDELSMIRKILNCKDEDGKNLGNKLNLFLEDSSWRKSAKDYSVFLLKYINSNSKNPEYIQHHFYPNSKETKQAFKAIDLITSIYLDEMK